MNCFYGASDILHMHISKMHDEKKIIRVKISTGSLPIKIECFHLQAKNFYTNLKSPCIDDENWKFKMKLQHVSFQQKILSLKLEPRLTELFFSLIIPLFFLS